MDAWETVVELYEDLGRSLPSELYMSDAMTGPIVWMRSFRREIS